MKVALIYAKNQDLRTQAAELFADEGATIGDGARDEIFPPLGITILAGWLLEAGYDVRLCDDSIESLRDQRSVINSEMFRQLREFETLKAKAKRSGSPADQKAADKCERRIDECRAELTKIRARLYRLESAARL